MKEARVPETDDMTRRLGENFVRLRRARGLSQTELGDQTEMHRNDVSLIERGKRRPRIDVLIKVAIALEVRPADLLEGISWTPATRKKPGRFRVDGR